MQARALWIYGSNGVSGDWPEILWQESLLKWLKLDLLNIGFNGSAYQAPQVALLTHLTPGQSRYRAVGFLRFDACTVRIVQATSPRKTDAHPAILNIPVTATRRDL